MQLQHIFQEDARLDVKVSNDCKSSVLLLSPDTFSQTSCIAPISQRTKFRANAEVTSEGHTEHVVAERRCSPP